MFKLIVAGGRDFNDYAQLEKIMTGVKSRHSDLVVISGMARGADRLGYTWAKKNGIEIVEMPANWDLHGKSAGYKRNAEMSKVGDALLAFWDGSSKGTQHMIAYAKERGKLVHVVNY